MALTIAGTFIGIAILFYLVKGIMIYVSIKVTAHGRTSV